MEGRWVFFFTVFREAGHSFSKRWRVCVALSRVELRLNRNPAKPKASCRPGCRPCYEIQWRIEQCIWIKTGWSEPSPRTSRMMTGPTLRPLCLKGCAVQAPASRQQSPGAPEDTQPVQWTLPGPQEAGETPPPHWFPLATPSCPFSCKSMTVIFFLLFWLEGQINCTHIQKELGDHIE